MNFNISSILSGSMKILNIVNKTLPLVKEFNPTISKMITKYKNNKVKEQPFVNKKPSPTPLKKLPNQRPSSNGLTFFR